MILIELGEKLDNVLDFECNACGYIQCPILSLRNRKKKSNERIYISCKQ